MKKNYEYDIDMKLRKIAFKNLVIKFMYYTTAWMLGFIIGKFL